MENLTNEMLQRLDLLAAKLGIATEHLWAVLVQQGTVEGVYGVASAILGVVFMAAGLYCTMVMLRVVKRADADWANGLMIGGIFSVLGTIAILGLGCVLLLNGINATRYLFNPEYFAICEIGKFL